MNLQTIAEHTVDLDLLPNPANILDLGCRGFQFTDYFRNLGHKVAAVDADELPPPASYLRAAVSNYTGWASLIKSSDPQATRIAKQPLGRPEVKCYTLEDLGKKLGVEFWDLIKIDVEGSEWEIIGSLTAPPAKQLSIEFHLHTGVYNTLAVMEMQATLASFGYVQIQHELKPAHGCGLNYWDSLFILE